MKKKYCKIEKLVKLAKKGDTFILVDDESRENEGDLVFLANKCTLKNKLYGKIRSWFNLFSA